jgi:WD40 repeat protein
MKPWDQARLLRKKYLIAVLAFLILFAVSLFLWTSLIPPRPRITIVPLIDSQLVAFSPDSRLLITREPQWYMPQDSMSSFDIRRRPAPIQVWDAENGTLLHSFADEWADMDEVIPAPNSRYLIGWKSGFPDSSPDLIETRDLVSGEKGTRVTLPAKEHSFASLGFSPDRKWLTITPRSGVMYQCWVWQLESDRLVRFDRIGPTVTISEDGQYMITSEQDSREFTIKVWRMGDFTRPEKEHVWTADEGVVFPDCQTVATYRVRNSRIAEAELWDVASGKRLDTFPIEDAKNHIRLFSIPSSSCILAHCVDHTASTAIWDVSGRPKLLFVLDEWRIDTSKDGVRMLQSEETGVALVDMRSGNTFSLTHETDASSSNKLAPGRFSPDGSMVIVTGIRRHARPSSIQKRICSALAIKAPEEWVPVARLWAVETGDEIAHYDGCGDVLFSPDCKTLATLQVDGTIQLWDIPARTVFWRVLGSAVALWLLSLLIFSARKRVQRQGSEAPT